MDIPFDGRMIQLMAEQKEIKRMLAEFEQMLNSTFAKEHASVKENVEYLIEELKKSDLI